MHRIGPNKFTLALCGAVLITLSVLLATWQEDPSQDAPGEPPAPTGSHTSNTVYPTPPTIIPTPTMGARGIPGC